MRPWPIDVGSPAQDGQRSDEEVLGISVNTLRRFYSSINVLIEPSPEGAVGTAYFAMMKSGAQEGQPSVVEFNGVYNDVFVKTRDGWKFKSRKFRLSRITVIYRLPECWLRNSGPIPSPSPARGEPMAEKDRGFASMPAHKRHEISSKGGKASHAKGVAHEWISEDAREAGRRGGMARHAKRKATEAVLNKRRAVLR